MKHLAHVIYISAVSEQFKEHEIPQLLERSREANAKHELTGMLLYLGDAFIQVLEGPGVIVDAVFATILRDRRHQQVIRLTRETIDERCFSEWAMAFSTVDPAEAGELIGNPLLFSNPAAMAQLDSSGAKKLIAALGNRRWKLERSGTFRALRRA